MKQNTPEISNDMSQLAEDARALMTATADVAGEQVGEARKRLAAALESGKEIYGRVREKAVEGAKAADVAVHAHPYQAVAIGVGLGALLGYLISRRCSCRTTYFNATFIATPFTGGKYFVQQHHTGFWYRRHGCYTGTTYRCRRICTVF